MTELGRLRRARLATVTVTIEDKDRKVGAMVKALAVEVSGFASVRGTTKEFLAAHGYYEFHFPSEGKAEEFRAAMRQYLPKTFAKVRE